MALLFSSTVSLTATYEEYQSELAMKQVAFNYVVCK